MNMAELNFESCNFCRVALPDGHRGISTRSVTGGSMNWTRNRFLGGASSAAEVGEVATDEAAMEPPERDRFKMLADGDASLGDGAYFCHGCGRSPWVGVVNRSSFLEPAWSTRGDIRTVSPLPSPLPVPAGAAAVALLADEVDGDVGRVEAALDISSNLAPLDELVRLMPRFSTLSFLNTGRGGLIRLWLVLSALAGVSLFSTCKINEKKFF